MHNKVNIDLTTLKFLYSRYKGFLVPVIVIFSSFALFVVVIIPQIQGLFTIKAKAQEASKKISVIRNNFNLLSNMSDSTLDSQLQILSFALPINKDFVGILNAVSSASYKSGVIVGSFQLQIGDLSQTPIDKSGTSTITLNLNIDGSVKDVSSFVGELGKTLPLSEVYSVEIGSNLSTVSIVFYYKPLPPITHNDSLPITPLSDKSIALINKISGFNSTLSGESFTPSSSESANSNPL